MNRFALSALTAILFAGGSTVAMAQSEAKQELQETQPQAKTEAATTGNVPATEEKAGEPATSGDTATINQPTEGAEKESNVEGATEVTQEAGDTATINQ